MSQPAVIVYPPSTNTARYLRSLGVSGGDPLQQIGFCEGRGWHGVAVAVKAAVAAQNSGDFAAATAPIFAGYIQSVSARTIPGRLATRPAILRTRMVVGAATATAHVVGEGQPAPMTAGSFSNVQVDPIQVTGMAVVTSEVLRAADDMADRVVLSELDAAVTREINRAFVDSAIGVTKGAPTINSSGSTLVAIDSDLRAVIQLALDAGIELEAPAWILSPQSAVYLAGLRGSGGALAFPGIGATGGQILGIEAFTSSAVGRAASPNERFITLVDAAQTLYAPPSAIELSLARSASVMMSDAPAPGQQQLVSLWQSGLVGLRATTYCGWHVARTGAVVSLDNVQF